jgi:general stress protein 26
MEKEFIEKAGKIINENITKLGYCSLGLINLENYPTVSTISPAKADGIKWITFVVILDSNKVKRIKHCNKASVCFNSDSPLLYNITLVGTIEILNDCKLKDESWFSGCEYHFTGIEDPNYCVLKFTTKKYNIFFDPDGISGTV